MSGDAVGIMGADGDLRWRIRLDNAALAGGSCCG